MQSTKCLPRTGGRIFKKAPVTNHISASGTRVQFCVERWEAVMGSISHFRSGTRVQFCVERRKAVMGSISLPCAQRWATSCHLFRSGGKTEQRSQLFRNKVLASDSLQGPGSSVRVCARVHVCACVCPVVQLCPTLCNSMNFCPPGSSVHGILQARILEQVAMPSSRVSSPPRDCTHVSCIGRRVLHCWALWEAPGCSVRSR